MAFSQSDLTALETAMKSGTLKVKYQDKEVTYRSFEEMQKLYGFIKAQIDTATAPDGIQASGGTRRILASFSKGIDSSDSDFDED